MFMPRTGNLSAWAPRAGCNRGSRAYMRRDSSFGGLLMRRKMRRLTLLAVLAIVATGLPAIAEARVDVDIGIGVPGPRYYRPHYYAPHYYAPPPVYYYPPPAVVYAPPPPIVYTPAP